MSVKCNWIDLAVTLKFDLDHKNSMYIDKMEEMHSITPNSRVEKVRKITFIMIT